MQDIFPMLFSARNSAQKKRLNFSDEKLLHANLSVQIHRKFFRIVNRHNHTKQIIHSFLQKGFIEL
jgi:hypothetical protein